MSTVARVSYDEFEAMIARGEFPPDDPTRYELIEGEILPMPPPDPIHEELLDRFNRWSFASVPLDRVRVRIQGTIGIPDLDGIPFPDATWLLEADYSHRRPVPAEVFLVVEVANFSLSYDRNAKARLYADAGLADCWIANIRGQCFEVLRDPGPDGYASKTVYYPGDVIRPIAFPDLAFPVSLFFPEDAAEAQANGATP